MKVFYSPDYVAASESFDTTRKAGWIAESLQREPIPGVELVTPAPLSSEDIARVHDPRYVEAVKTGKPRELAESPGFKWDPGVWKAVTSVNGGVVEAARAALEDGVAGSLSSGLHHAQYTRGASFCTFNGLAIAAKTMLQEGVRQVLIIDLDAHCGGGTHSIIESDSRIRQVDVSVNAVDAYWMNGNNTLDIVREAEKYLPTIEQRLFELEKYTPALCIYNAGMDPDERCIVGGVPGIDANMLKQREELIFHWAKRRDIAIAFVLAGGYVGERLSQNDLVALHRLTISTAAQR